MNAELFSRIDVLWDARDAHGLTPEQERVLMLTRQRMVRAGAALSDGGKMRLAEVMTALAALQTQFTQNLLADEAGWSMEIAPDPPTARS